MIFENLRSHICIGANSAVKSCFFLSSPEEAHDLERKDIIIGFGEANRLRFEITHYILPFMKMLGKREQLVHDDLDFVLFEEQIIDELIIHEF